MKRILAILLCFLFIGCASISFNPETSEVKYTRIGDQQISGLEVNKTANGVKIKLEGQQSNADALAEAIKIIGTLTPK